MSDCPNEEPPDAAVATNGLTELMFCVVIDKDADVAGKKDGAPFASIGPLITVWRTATGEIGHCAAYGANGKTVHVPAEPFIKTQPAPAVAKTYDATPFIVLEPFALSVMVLADEQPWLSS